MNLAQFNVDFVLFDRIRRFNPETSFKRGFIGSRMTMEVSDAAGVTVVKYHLTVKGRILWKFCAEEYKPILCSFF